MVRPGHHEQPEQPSKRTVTHQKKIRFQTPSRPNQRSPSTTHPDRRSGRSISPVLAHERPEGAANVSLPSLCNCQRP
jgi:hypothetical protein